MRFPLINLLLLLSVQTIEASPFDMKVGNSGELEEYIAERDKRIKSDPRNPALYIERGDARFLDEDFSGAVEDYTKSIELDDTLSEAYLGRGLALGRAGLIKDGIADLDIYIKRNPKSSLGYTKRGVRYLWLGEGDKAKSDFEQALKLDPDNVEAHDDLGVVLAQQGLYDEAGDHFMSAIEIDTGYQSAYYNMALVNYLSNSHQQALVYIVNALALAPKSRDALILKAKILESLGREEEALSVLNDAQSLPEKDWSEGAPLQ
jgi:tetratricopeptide (TPR) repeat protein